MKKLYSLLLSTTLAIGISLTNISPVKAETPIKIAIDNTIIKSDQAPVIKNGRTLVPVRFVSEQLSYQVNWDNTNKNVYIYDYGVSPQTFKNSTNDIQVYLNNKKITFADQKPVIINGRTLIPLRAVAENMNVSVNWDDTKKQVNINTSTPKTTTSNQFSGYTLIEVDGGDLSGTRKPNVVVDIGYGDRKYYAFTNEYGQLVKVTADKITLQDATKEKVLSTGRYYSDEAKVPGVESDTLDEGHVIADSLGGVSNAYNITPQNSTLNRYGDQAYMEKNIREANGATNFTAIITYPNTKTQIPSHYSFTYTLKGNVIHDEFDNVNPDEVNAKITTTQTPTKPNTQNTSSNNNLAITNLDKNAEYIIIKNNSNTPVNMTGYTILSVKGGQKFTFPTFTLNANSSVKVGDKARNSDVSFHWLDGNGTWNNSESDPAELYDAKGNLISRLAN